MKKEIKQKELMELLEYQNGGFFTWKVSRKKARKGDVAGSVTKGKNYIGLKFTKYPVSKLVWLWHYGYIPTGCLKRFDGDVSNDKIENLMPSNWKILNKRAITLCSIYGFECSTAMEASEFIFNYLRAVIPEDLLIQITVNMVNKESLEREVTKETIENVFKETKEFLEKTKNLNNNKKTEKIK
jgi:hypothetical protein